MNTKKIEKIREMLGDRFHLAVETDLNDKFDWSLFRKYENCDPIYWSADNKAIMRGTERDIDKLYEYAKNHKVYDIEKIDRRYNTILIYVAMLLCVANFFFDTNGHITTIILTIDLICMIRLIINWIVSNRKFKVDMLELRENYEISYNDYLERKARLEDEI